MAGGESSRSTQRLTPAGAIDICDCIAIEIRAIFLFLYMQFAMEDQPIPSNSLTTSELLEAATIICM
jgi:hypothetical protein